MEEREGRDGGKCGARDRQREREGGGGRGRREAEGERTGRVSPVVDGESGGLAN